MSFHNYTCEKFGLIYLDLPHPYLRSTTVLLDNICYTIVRSLSVLADPQPHIQMYLAAICIARSVFNLSLRLVKDGNLSTILSIVVVYGTIANNLDNNHSPVQKEVPFIGSQPTASSY